MHVEQKPSLIELPPDNPNLPIKPPLVFVATLVIGLLVDWVKPMPARPDRWGGLGIIFCGIAIALMGGAALALKRRRTDVRPWKPTTALVTEGPFALTRNPIYLGFALLQVGIGLWSDKLAVLLMTVVGIAITNNVIIAREESYLFRKFGAEYERYLAQARRWL